MSLRCGSLVFATDSGLGILARALFDHGIITDPVIVRHGKHPTHLDWYPPGTPVISDLRRDGERIALDALRGVDVFLALETPFLWGLVPKCRERGVKTALMTMYECGLTRPPYEPDLYLCPSLLDLRYYPRGVFLPVPVDTARVPWRRRDRAEVFVHNAGHGGLKGRNGTREVLEAARYVRSQARFIVRSQDTQFGVSNDRWDFFRGTLAPEALFAEGDVFVFPEKFNGLSLPLQEAHAAGMLVMAGARFPMTEWLPNEPLIPVQGYRKSRIGPPYNEFDEAVYDPRQIAATIDAWYGRDITELSERGRAWAEANSWEALRPRYIEVAESLL